jgi:hypothetical protein
VPGIQGDDAMIIPDYVAIGVLIILAVLAGSMLFARGKAR